MKPDDFNKPIEPIPTTPNKRIVQEFDKNHEYVDEYIKKSKATIYCQKLMTKIIELIPQNGSFLDVGVGSGAFLNQLMNYAEIVGREDIKFYGFDASEAMKNHAERLCNPEGNKIKAKIYHDDLLNPTSEIKNFQFDFVNCMNVLFYFSEGYERDNAISNLKKFTKKDGILNIQVREKKPDLARTRLNKSFSDFSKSELEGCLVMGFGFEILSSKIGEKIPFGPDTEDNKDRFFNKLEVMVKNSEQQTSTKITKVQNLLEDQVRYSSK